MAWVVNKAFPDEGIDMPYKHYNRKTGATPLNALTPLYAGERVLCTIDGKQYQALAATSDSWVDCGCSGPE